MKRRKIKWIVQQRVLKWINPHLIIYFVISFYSFILCSSNNQLLYSPVIGEWTRNMKVFLSISNRLWFSLFLDNSELLMILIDINARSWELPEKVTDPNEENEAQKTFLEFLSNFFAFMNTYVNYSNTNQISIMLYGQGPAYDIQNTKSHFWVEKSFSLKKSKIPRTCWPIQRRQSQSRESSSRKWPTRWRDHSNVRWSSLCLPFLDNSSLEQALSLGMCCISPALLYNL